MTNIKGKLNENSNILNQTDTILLQMDASYLGMQTIHRYLNQTK